MNIIQYNNSFLGRIMYSTTCASKAILSKLCYNESIQLPQTALELSAQSAILYHFCTILVRAVRSTWRYRYRYRYLNSEFSCSLLSSICQPHSWSFDSTHLMQPFFYTGHTRGFLFYLFLEAKGLQTSKWWLISCTTIICINLSDYNEFLYVLIRRMHMI